MEYGWIKLHRKLLNNPIFRHDPNAWRVFEILLLLVDHKNGQYDTGRFFLSGIAELKPTTVYKALKRLENAKMVTQVSNNRFTTIHICNWEKYQGDGNNASDNKVTTKGQQSNNKVTLNKNIRTKELINKNTTTTTDVVEAKPQLGNPQLNELLEYAKTLNFPLQGTQRMNRFSAHNLLKKYGIDKSKRMVQFAVKVQGQQFAPTINDFTQLYRKVGDLAVFYKRETSKKRGVIKYEEFKSDNRQTVGSANQ